MSYVAIKLGSRVKGFKGLGSPVVVEEFLGVLAGKELLQNGAPDDLIKELPDPNPKSQSHVSDTTRSMRQGCPPKR